MKAGTETKVRWIAQALPIAIFGISTLHPSAGWTSPERPQFPVPRAEPEFRTLIPFIVGWAEENRGDQEFFKRWVLPFAPLSLEVRNATPDEASDLQNFYLGFAGRAFGINSLELANRFHCGPTCTQNRRTDLQGKLPRIEPLVREFRELKGIRLLANWGMGHDFRVNDLYRIGEQVRMTRPSSLMGFVPSDTWIPVEDPDAYIATLGADPKAVRSLIGTMRELSIAAVVRDPNDVVRVIRVGLSDNESGLLFTQGDTPPCKKGVRLKDGREVALLETLKPHVYFYETS